MGSDLKPGKQTVELQAEKAPSRIRRDPPPIEKLKSVRSYPTEQETWTVVIGVAIFGIALMVIVLGFSDFTSR